MFHGFWVPRVEGILPNVRLDLQACFYLCTVSVGAWKRITCPVLSTKQPIFLTILPKPQFPTTHFISIKHVLHKKTSSPTCHFTAAIPPTKVAQLPSRFQAIESLPMYQGVSENSGFSPQIIPLKHRVFHWFFTIHFGVFPYFFGNTHTKDRCDFSFHFELGPIALDEEFDSSTKKAYDFSGWAAKQAVWLWEKNWVGRLGVVVFLKPKISNLKRWSSNWKGGLLYTSSCLEKTKIILFYFVTVYV